MSKYPTEWQRLVNANGEPRSNMCGLAHLIAATNDATSLALPHRDRGGGVGWGPGVCSAQQQQQQHLKVPPDWRTNKHTLEQTEAGGKTNFMRPLTELWRKWRLPPNALYGPI